MLQTSATSVRQECRQHSTLLLLAGLIVDVTDSNSGPPSHSLDKFHGPRCKLMTMALTCPSPTKAPSSKSSSPAPALPHRSSTTLSPSATRNIPAQSSNSNSQLQSIASKDKHGIQAGSFAAWRLATPPGTPACASNRSSFDDSCSMGHSLAGIWWPAEYTDSDESICNGRMGVSRSSASVSVSSTSSGCYAQAAAAMDTAPASCTGLIGAEVHADACISKSDTGLYVPHHRKRVVGKAVAASGAEATRGSSLRGMVCCRSSFVDLPRLALICRAVDL